MNYYEHHIGDYDADTAHLTWAEDMAYTRLLRLYYRRERAVPADFGEACRLVRATSREQKQAVEAVLREFFVLREDGWHQARCDGEIEKYQHRVAHNQRVGKLGGRPRKLKPGENPTGFDWVPEKNPPQSPYPSPQTPEDSVPIGTGGDAAKPAAADPQPAGQPPITAEQVNQLTKDELWRAGKSLLHAEGKGLPMAQCGSFVGKLVKDYGDQIVVDAVRAAVVTRPADPVEYLKATCMRAKGQRAAPNRQEALEQRNRAVAHAWAQGASDETH